MKKQFLIPIMAIMITMSLSACGNQNQNNESQTEPITETTTEVITEAPTEKELDFYEIKSACKSNYGTYGVADESRWNEDIIDRFSISSDGQSMSIECNNSWDSTKSIVFTAVQCMNKELGFGTSLNSKMSMTRAIDGMQTDENDKVKVSWNYHPKNGLTVIYEKK